MPIHELNEEQIRTWSLEQKDRWWLENVYRGDMPQLTIRSALTGMLLGGLLSLTNLYVGAKTGWSLGVGITSVILAFAAFKVLSDLKLAGEFTILENNAMQSIATAAGYMTSPLTSSMAAYMMFRETVVPMWQVMSWMIVLSIVGVLYAFPFKRRFINDEQQPFPEGRAAGVVMDALHHGDAAAGVLKGKLLIATGALAALVKLLQSERITSYLRIKWLHLPEFLDTWLYDRWGTATILGTKLPALTIRPELELAMVGAGGLMGMRTAFSMMLGATVNFAILAPIMIQWGDIVPENGQIGFRQITFWSLWCGVSMMTAASLLAFFSKPEIIWGSLRKLAGGMFRTTGDGQTAKHDILGHIELPLSVSMVGVPVIGAVVAIMGKSYFEIDYTHTIIALALVSLFSLIAINSTALTSVTPLSAMGKLTQLTFGVVAPGDTGVNLMTAGITGEVAGNAANLLQDIKPGYMLGAKPRQQAIGHVLGIFAGALIAVPVFYFVFLKLPADQAFAADLSAKYEIDERYSMPSATTWKAVADVMAKGISNIKVSARFAALAGVLIGIAMEVTRLATKDRFPLSPVAIGLGFIIHFHTCLCMFAGALFFWILQRVFSNADSRVNAVVVQNQEPISAGLIAGGSLMGIVVAIAELLLPASK